MATYELQGPTLSIAQEITPLSYKCSPALFHTYILSCLLHPLELGAGHIHLWCLLSSTAPSEAICKKRTVKISSQQRVRQFPVSVCSVLLEGVREMLQAGRGPGACPCLIEANLKINACLLMALH